MVVLLFYLILLQSLILMSFTNGALPSCEQSQSQACPAGLTCKDNVCSCPSATFYDEGTSSCRQIFGTTCSSNGECYKISETMLECSAGNNTCACSDGSYFHELRGVCISPMYKRCSSELNCLISEDGHGGCNVYEVFHKSKICSCSKGYAYVRGYCQANHWGQPCLDSPESNENNRWQEVSDQQLKCINGVYNCKNPVGQSNILYMTDNRCSSRLGSLCDPNNNDSDLDNCPEDSICSPNKFKTGTFTCQCKPGFSPTPRGVCLKDYGTSCSETDLASKPCNNFQGLVCLDGRCECAEDMVEFDIRARKCLSPVGYYCGHVEIRSYRMLHRNKYSANEQEYLMPSSVHVGCVSGSKCEVLSMHPKNSVCNPVKYGTV